MFGIGMPELLVILVVALFIVGPKKLPGLAKNLGKGIAELKKSANEVVSSVTETEDFKDLKDIKDNLNDAASLVRDPIDAVTSSIKSEINDAIDVTPEKSNQYMIEPHVDQAEDTAKSVETQPAGDKPALQDSPKSEETQSVEEPDADLSQTSQTRDKDNA
jgi:sec-independent protein translocase protein TatB